jgi:hypothetical protein
MSGRLSLRVAGAAFAVWLLMSGVAAAQEVGEMADQLKKYDVAFEPGAVSDEWLDQLDKATAELQGSDGYFKVVVLADNVDDFSDTDDYADALRAELGGKGRVMVYSPTSVALSSNLDSSSQIDAAERAAAGAINNGDTLAEATADAAGKLSGDVSDLANKAADAADGGGGGSSGIWGFFAILLIPLAGLFGLMWWTGRKMRKRAQEASAQEIGAAETKVREAVDKAANDLLDLADRVDQPGAPAEAKAAFTQGAELFTTVQGLLETADTRPELEAAYPKVVDAGWQLDTARALLDGHPAPAKPEPEDLFPPVMVPSSSAPAEPGGIPGLTGAGAGAGAGTGAPAPARPEPHYRQSSASPWITAAAMAAITMLSQRGMSVPQTRPSMDDGAFGNWSGGLPPVPSQNSNRGFGFGFGKRGGRSGGPVMTPSGQGRRGVARR